MLVRAFVFALQARLLMHRSVGVVSDLFDFCRWRVAELCQRVDACALEPPDVIAADVGDADEMIQLFEMPPAVKAPLAE